MEWNRKRVITVVAGAAVLAVVVYGAVLAYLRLTNPYYGLTTQIEVANMTPEIRATIDQRIAAAKASIAAAEQAGEEIDLDQYMIISEYALVMGDLVMAREALEKVLEVNEINAVAINNYAYILERMGDYEGAEESYRKVLGFSGSNEEFHRDLITLIETYFPERSSEVEGLLLAAVEDIGQTPWLMVKLGREYLKQGDCDKSIAHFKVAVTLDPENQAIADELATTKQECAE